MTNVLDGLDDPPVLGGSDEDETIFDGDASISNDFILVSSATFSSKALFARPALATWAYVFVAHDYYCCTSFCGSFRYS